MKQLILATIFAVIIMAGTIAVEKLATADLTFKYTPQEKAILDNAGFTNMQVGDLKCDAKICIYFIYANGMEYRRTIAYSTNIEALKGNVTADTKVFLDKILSIEKAKVEVKPSTLEGGVITIDDK